MRLRLFVLVAFLGAHIFGLMLAPPALADSQDVLISEVQVADTEFVELYNESDSPVDLSGWKLEYHATTSTTTCDDPNWSTKISLPAKSIPANGFFLAGPKTDPASDVALSFGLSNTAGAVKLVDPSGQTADALAWGNAPCGEGTHAPAPAAGQSLERRPGAEIENGGNAYDTDDNLGDFMLRDAPDPQSTASPAEVPAASYVPIGDSGSIGDSSAPLQLNELFPDPAAPLTDAKDEFIEFYNPNDTPVDLKGYVVKTGANLSTSHTLSGGAVPAEGYLAVKSADTKIALANDGSSVALYDPSGTQVGETVTYPKAPTGSAWALFDDSWQWTTTPTPGDANVLSDDPAAAAAASKTAKPKTTTKKATSSKAKTTKAKAAKAAKSKAGKSGSGLASLKSPGGYWLLFALAGLTIAYVIYEFRYDLRNLYFKFRGYPETRDQTRQAPAGRGSDRAGERPGRWQDHLRARLSSWSWLPWRRHQSDVHAQSDIQTPLF